jgi:hypothetical protein
MNGFFEILGKLVNIHDAILYSFFAFVHSLRLDQEQCAASAKT